MLVNIAEQKLFFKPLLCSVVKSKPGENDNFKISSNSTGLSFAQFE